MQAARLLSALQEAPEIEITFFPLNRPFPRPLKWVKRIPLLRTLGNVLFYNAGLLYQAWRHDVLHVFTAGLWSYTLWTIPALAITRLFGKKSVVNYRDGRAEQHLQHWRSARPTLLWADRIVAPSGYLVDVFAQYGIRAQSIFNIIDAERFRYRERRKLRPIFLANRSLEPLYNVGCILRAFEIIQSRYPEASLTIAHDGICRAELESLAADLKLRNTRFVGKVAPTNVPDLYDQADIYLTSPNLDCMPGSLLECFASGLPIVATEAGGIPYIAKNRKSALLVGLNDHEGLAQRAMELLENPDLVERLTRSGREQLQRYRPERVRDAWVALYQEITGAGLSSHGLRAVGRG